MSDRLADGAKRLSMGAEPSFRRYILFRKYDFGRGSREGWNFVTLAKGDPDLPEVGSWKQLHVYLEQKGGDESLVRGARAVWSSFTAYRARQRAAGAGE